MTPVISFSMALDMLKNGKVMQREAWSKDHFVVIMSGLCLPPYNTQDTMRKVNDRTAQWIGEHRSLDSQPYFASCTLLGEKAKWNVGWTPTADDLLATDWVEFKSE